jgi:hypothetical protein
MRRLAALALVALAAAGCGSRDHGSKLFTSAKETGEAPGGPLAGGRATLTRSGDTVTGKNVLVLRLAKPGVVVRNPNGGSLTVVREHAAGGRIVASPGDHMSFKGTRSGERVIATTVAVIHTR